MSLSVSLDFVGAANVGRRDFLDSGPGHATIEVYSTDRPGSGAAPGGSPMVVVVLAKPCGEVIDGLLHLVANEPAGELILVGDGSTPAKWARFKNGAGAWAMDADVSVSGGGGEVQFPNINLIAGGRAPLSPSIIG